MIPLGLTLIGVCLTGITLSILGARAQFAQNQAAKAQAATDAKRERSNARRRYLYRLRRLPRFKISTSTYRGDL